MKRNTFFSLTILTVASLGLTQLSAAPRSRVAANVNYQQRTRLKGHVHPNATADNDAGPLDPAQVLSGITLMLKPTAEQEVQLDRLLADQQDPSSASYHAWLSPEEYADRFVSATRTFRKLRHGWKASI